MSLNKVITVNGTPEFVIAFHSVSTIMTCIKMQVNAKGVSV